jgi:Na+/H+ antiporter NhaD/arsenite permease-like protein
VITAAILLSVYAVIAFGRAPLVRLDRAGAAIVGALLMVVAGSISFDEAVRAVDVHTIVLLFGMMVITAHLRLAGGFTALARFLSSRITHPAALLVALVLVGGLLSAFFVNDTICLVFTPIALDVAAARRHRPLPYLLALATASNIGSVATVTGNPQNMLIGSLSRLPFRTFASALFPVALAGLALDAALLWLMFRGDLHRSAEDEARIQPVRPHWPLLVKSLLVTAGVLTGFLLGYDTAVVAMAGAAALLVTRRVKPEKVYRAVDWDLLMLFVGLFVIVGAAEKSGLSVRVFDTLRPLGVHTVAGLTVAAALLSNVISNVPAVMLFTHIIPLTPDPQRAWLTLAMASTLAGNLTILGSIANLIVVEGARRRGVAVSFGEYARVGLPLTLATLAFGAWWLS